MTTNPETIRNKQRIAIAGQGSKEIAELIIQVLKHTSKLYETPSARNEKSPVILLQESDFQTIDELAELKPHILLIHELKESGVAKELKQLAERLPKAGTLIYFAEDSRSNEIGKKEIADVKYIDYGRPKSTKTTDGYELLIEDKKIQVKTDNKDFPAHLAGAKALLKRLGITGDQIAASLNNR